MTFVKALRIGTVAAGLGMLSAGSAFAAEPVFPPASKIGLVPPAGFVVSKTFTGFEDSARQSVIVMRELPADAYANLNQSMTDEALAKQGIALEGREAVKLAAGEGVLLAGRQVENGVALKKWVLLAAVSDLTGIVTVQVPDAHRDAYPETAIRAALMSLAVRPQVPLEERLSVLPYTLGELGGFRLVRVIPGNAAALTEGPSDTIEFSEQPLILITIAPGTPLEPSDWNDFARRAFATLPGLKDVQFSRAGPLRIRGQPGHEIVADATDAKTGTKISVVQWLRFGTNSHLRMVAIGRRDAWPGLFQRFRAVRDGIGTR